MLEQKVDFSFLFLVLISLGSGLVGVLVGYNPVWAIGAVAGGAYSLILLTKTWGGFLFFMLYSATHLWLAQNLKVVPTYTDDVLFYPLMIVCILYLTNSKSSQQRLCRVRGYLGLYVICILYLVSSAFLTGSISAIWGLREFIQYSVLTFLTLIILEDEIQAQKAFRWLIRLGVIVACLAFVGMLEPMTGLSEIYTDNRGPDMLRVVSTMGNPNTMAYFLGLIMLCYLPLLWQRSTWGKILPPLLFVMAIVLSLSRSALVLFAFASVVEWILYLKFDGQLRRFFWHSKIQRKWLYAVAGLLLVGACSFIIALPMLRQIPNLLLSRISWSRITDFEVVLEPRLRLWRSLLEGRDASLFFGSGVGSVTGRNELVEEVRVIDSYWLKILLEQGVTGIILMAGLLLDLVRRSWHLCNDKRTQNIGVVSVVIIGCIGISGLFYTILDVFPLNLFFWVGMGFVLFYDIESSMKNG